MRYYRLDERLIAREGESARDLTAADATLDSFDALAATAADRDAGVDAVARSVFDDAPAVGIEELADPDRPVVPPEVWAAGVTYKISEEARAEESTMPEMYMDVYDAERPEIFFKATPGRTVGPNESIGIRADSDWDVPEPELGVVLHEGEIVGFTVGNDVSSRDIEGQNPLYLPQAKVYDRCCSLGPAVVGAGSIEDPHALAMEVEIERDGETVFADATTTGEMVRTCEELVGFLTRHNVVPETTVLLTGTSLVPPDEFTLEVGDRVSVEIEGIGTLANDVIEV